MAALKLLAAQNAAPDQVLGNQRNIYQYCFGFSAVLYMSWVTQIPVIILEWLQKSPFHGTSYLTEKEQR